MKNINTKQYRRMDITASRVGKMLYVYILMSFLTTGCEDFVDVDLPKNQLTAEVVFEDAATATGALRHIYALMRDGGLPSSLSRGLGLYTDELEIFNIQSAFYDHSLSALNPAGFWSSSYNLIYASNAVIEGVENSISLDLEDQNQLKGEALFIRAYIHFLLVELYGPIPYIKTTDYAVNTTISRKPVDEVYNFVIEDLIEASDLLGEDISTERTRVYDAVAEALLARVYLYTQQWNLADELASNVIDRFVLEPDLNKVFLKNGSGSIWQFKPVDGWNTQDGTNFIFSGRPHSLALSSSLKEAFEPNDLRLSKWVGESTYETGSTLFTIDTSYYAFKYKQASNTPSSLEYPVVFRLAEQYLIRAEARAEQEKLEEAQIDLNIIRNRAGLEDTTAANREDLLNAIFLERQVELFTEQGHRWFDLKRIRKAAEVLSPIKSGWRDTNILFPVPESEILLNPNLLPQNDGYN